MTPSVKIKKILKTDLGGFKVKVKFSNNIVATLSLNFIFESPKNLSAEILRGGMFSKCFVESGSLAWPNGFELCPNALYRTVAKKTQRNAS